MIVVIDQGWLVLWGGMGMGKTANTARQSLLCAWEISAGTLCSSSLCQKK